MIIMSQFLNNWIVFYECEKEVKSERSVILGSSYSNRMWKFLPGVFWGKIAHVLHILMILELIVFMLCRKWGYPEN